MFLCEAVSEMHFCHCLQKTGGGQVSKVGRMLACLHEQYTDP